MARIEENWLKRQKIWKLYSESFSGLPIDLPTNELVPKSKHAHHLYTILIRDDAPVDRDEFILKMQENNIGTGVHYRSIPGFSFYQDSFGWNPDDYPNSTSIGNRTVSIPLSPGLSENDLNRIIEKVNSILK